MRMPDEIEQEMARVDRAIGNILDRRNRNRWTALEQKQQEDELVRASLNLLNKIRRHEHRGLTSCSECHKQAVCVLVDAEWLCGSCGNERVSLVK